MKKLLHRLPNLLLALVACKNEPVEKAAIYPATYVVDTIQKSPVEVYTTRGRVLNYRGTGHQTFQFTDPKPARKDSIALLSRTKGAIYWSTIHKSLSKKEVKLFHRSDSLWLIPNSSDGYWIIDLSSGDLTRLETNPEKATIAATVKAKFTNDQLQVPT
ncbi:MAG: hypothetical protein H7Z75_20770 [Ferruginibacter sp.]|nr:hypothetical protein [Cytophagales bacterium]